MASPGLVGGIQTRTHEKMVFKEKSERSKGVNHKDTGKKSSPGRDNSRLKGPGAEMCLKC